MKKLLNIAISLVTMLLTDQQISFAQSHSLDSFGRIIKKEKLFINVYTDDAVYKGILRGVDDSSIKITKRRQYSRLREAIAVKDIQQIVFSRKNALLKNMLEGFAAGTILGALYAIKSYLGTPSYDREYSFGEYVLAGSFVGAGLGIIKGAIPRFFLRIIIPIYKSQRLFEEEKSRLKEFVIY